MRADLVQPPPGVEEAVVAARRDVEQAMRDAAEARADAEVARAQARVGRVVLSPEVDGGRGSMSVTRNGDGQTVVQLPDGRTIRIDPRAVPALQDQQALIQHALSSVPPEEQGPPQSLIVLTGLVLFFIALMVIGWPIARAMGRRIDRKSAGTPAISDSEARLARIENAVESIAVEVERVSENQRFATRLLSERAEADGVSARAREAVHAR
jgi:hypothetical protein